MGETLRRRIAKIIDHKYDVPMSMEHPLDREKREANVLEKATRILEMLEKERPVGVIEWLPIAMLPEAFKDGRWIMLSGGKADWEDDVSYDPPSAVTSFWGGDLNGWIVAFAEAGFVAAGYADPTHFAEINGPT